MANRFSRVSWVAGIAVACAVQLQAADAHAQRDPFGDPHFAVKLMLGLGGEAEVAALESDLLATWGAGLQYMHPLHRNFALGGAFSVQSWQTEAGDDADLDRNVLADLVLVPAAKLPLNGDVELYLAVPLGVSVDFLGEDQVGGASLGAEIDAAPGFTLGLLFGARFALSSSAGLLAEVGYTVHAYEHEGTAFAGALAASGNFDVDLGQFALNVGVFF